ncbi:endonuclease/exonuclease/phosphatase family protein [Streptomyces sp. N2-109]|uniref:Endonuclease/exonuclease/phosphatase family protein n=1 Tax=Streptomyces gossypii TaxID=2883101 RepID=A0ABT2K1T2_9ACTN|nr:endonuclease/exonuclease/phosphatase family protein [Streptomyces gossypii]MCT2594134.1 endonuclease/exonuclease/phosphatase family protein [Streptomyces gossypii]
MHTGEEQYRGEVPPEIRRTADTAPAPAVPDSAARRARRRRVLGWCAALLLFPVSVPLVFRGIDADGATPIPQLLAFLPWFLAPAWLALALAVLGRRWLVTVWSVAVLATTGWFIQPYGADAPPPREHPPTARFRVLTANLQYGQATEALLREVQRERPQLVSVQECESTCVEALRGAELREAYPHRVITEAGGAGGSALLSTYPLHTRTPVPGQLTMPSAVAEIGGREVRIQVAHPMPPEPSSMGAWKRELGNLRDWAARGDQPRVIAGDFNATQDHAAFRDILETGLRDAARLQGQSRTPTWPTATSPPLGAQIDHVLLSRHFEAADAQFLDLPGSDHRGLLVDLKMY